MGAISKIIVGGLGLLGIVIAFDSTCGRQACIESCTRQERAPVNGDPVGAAISRFWDNLNRMSVYEMIAPENVENKGYIIEGLYAPFEVHK